MNAKYKHTNIIARDWKRLAEFYETVFGCKRLPPERHVSEKSLSRGTGVSNASLTGVHLLLPGHGDGGPTLEILQYAENEPRPVTAANREGIMHMAFEVEDVEAALKLVLDNGGSKIGDVSTVVIEGAGTVTFVYVADPEGNILEPQRWDAC